MRAYLPKKWGVMAKGYVKAVARPLNNFPIVNILAAKTLNLQICVCYMAFL